MRLLASGALALASEAMPAQAIADTPQLLTINCNSGVVGGPSLGKLTRDIAARCENVRFSLAKKGTPYQVFPTWAANQCASSDHQRKPLEFLLAYCHMCPRTNHSGDMGLLGTGSVTLRGAES
ncbi:hypothetical protein HaLaN_01051 [Haematococcus lacustris]|uniref:Uncharacterized protein n=1 Tax=Haematococcus lacustris TaxID=44745 RepID=A0A699YHQ5_HAELA|nr:hypothetical protein HaLaN_01051 [Haematococcus lacustris]